MTSIAPERSWLFDPGLLKLVHQCRRLIHTEFGVKLHLTEDHLEQHLASYANKTRSTQLIRTWETLKDQIPGYQEHSKTAEANGARRVYRGQVIAEDPAPAVSSGDTPLGDLPASKKKVIYRGQVLN